MGGVLRSDWGGVLELVELFLGISWHGYFQYDRLVFLVQCDSTIKTPCPILCYFILFLEHIYEVLGILYFMVYYSKFVNHKGKCYYNFFVAP